MSTTNGTANGAEQDFNTLVIDDYATTVDALAPKTIQTAILRTFRHVLQNEVASAVSQRMEKLNADRTKAGEPELDEDELKFEKERITKELRDEKWEDILDGTWGLNTRGSSGPRVSAFETEYNRLLAAIAKAKLKAAEKNNGAVYDKTEKNWTFFRMLVNSEGVSEKVPASVRTVESTVEEIKASSVPGTVKQREEAAEEARRIVEFKQRRADMAKTAGEEAFAI